MHADNDRSNQVKNYKIKMHIAEYRIVYNINFPDLIQQNIV